MNKPQAPSAQRAPGERGSQVPRTMTFSVLSAQLTAGRWACEWESASAGTVLSPRENTRGSGGAGAQASESVGQDQSSHKGAGVRGDGEKDRSARSGLRRI